MDNILVHPHKTSSRRSSKASNVPLRPDGLPAKRLSKAPHDGVVAGTVSRTLRTLKSANDLWLSWKDGMTTEEREQLRIREERKQFLSLRMKTAESHQQWETAAQELDHLEGNNSWKESSEAGDYNPKLIEQRLRQLDEARASSDIRSMMHLIRTALSRDLGGMGNVDLYRHSYVGTKKLIERYVESTIQTIDAVLAQSSVDQGIQYRDLLEGMLFSRQSFGRSALLLSGGGTFGMTHIGVLKALFEAQLLPRIISGASAGSIVCAVMCTRTDEEMPGLINEFPHGDLAVFGSEDSKLGVLEHLRQLLTEGSWSDIKHLTRVMRNLTGDLTFQEAYNRTRRILNICVSTSSIYELPRLLNYVTAPNVMIWSAVAASCSVPLVFTTSSLLVKDPLTGEHRPWNPSPERFIDGSVDNDLPMTRLSEMFNVNHFIVSQVNPHVVPFLSKDDHLDPEDKTNRHNTTTRDESDWVNVFTTLAKDEALHRLQFMAEMGILPNLMTKLRSILSQKYSGDITILPEIDMYDLPRLLSNPTTEFMLKSCLLGERASWPKLSRIRDRCAIELALDRAVHQLRTRVVFSESQRNLRKLSTGFSSMRMNPPVSISTQSSAMAASPERHRRRSGGSLQALQDGRGLISPEITDDETAEEERLELRARRSHGGSPVSARKPRLKRASKSHIHVPQHGGPPPNPGDRRSVLAPAFDFSRPLPVSREHRNREEAQLDPFSKEEKSFMSSRDNMTSTEDVETSEQGLSSDADVELGTEESDPEPYDQQTVWSPSSKYVFRDDSDVFSQTRFVNGDLWNDFDDDDE